MQRAERVRGGLPMRRYLLGALRIARKDLLLEARQLSGVTAMFVLALAIVLTFAFCFGLTTMRRLGPERLVPGVLWISLLFSSLGGMRSSFASERERDTLTAILISPLDPSCLYFGKLLSNLALVFALEAALLPLTAVLFGWDLFSALPAVALVVVLHTLGFVALGTFFSAMVTRLGQGEALMAILILPLSVPLIISAGKTTEVAIALRPLAEVRFWLGLTGAFDAMALAASLLVFEYLVEE
jgi:heme exporter protein B